MWSVIKNGYVRIAVSCSESRMQRNAQHDATVKIERHLTDETCLAYINKTAGKTCETEIK